MKELNIFCLAVIVVAAALDTGAALLKTSRQAPAVAVVDVTTAAGQ